MDIRPPATIKQNLSLGIILLVNLLFGIKYLSRYSLYGVIAAVGIIGLQYLIVKSSGLLYRFKQYLKFIDLFILAVFVGGAVIVFMKVPVESLNVDRWSVISSFWNNYFDGKYVYYAKSHMGNPPGPMPFYYILALPFYMLGEQGIFSLAGVVVFYLLLKKTSLAPPYRTLGLLMAVSSLFYLWEVMCRSNIFINGVLVLLSLVFFLNSRKNNATLVISAVLTGLLLSTRNVFAIPYIIMFLYSWKAKEVTFKQLFVMGTIAIVVFALTFIPFAIGIWADFMVMNPFVVQSSFLMPFGYTLVFIAMAIVSPLLCRLREDVYFYSGLVLFLTILFYVGYQIVTTSYKTALIDSGADISYLILCTPFLVYYYIAGRSNRQAMQQSQ